uniref:hypothetical protein n=1 Tax=Escherichia coli TaxID=562 RepID=UPI001ED8CFBE|nr:hypothetical protein [Escherichia coli]
MTKNTRFSPEVRQRAIRMVLESQDEYDSQCITIDDCWEGWAILLRQKQKKLIMLPSETMIWQPEFTDKTLSRKPGAVQTSQTHADNQMGWWKNETDAFHQPSLPTRS